MIRGLYTSGWSMIASNKKMDVISNNLANVNTTGFKKDLVVFQSFPSVLAQRLNDTKSKLNPDGKIGSMQLGNDVGEIFTYFNQGQLAKSDNSFDLSLNDAPSAFFSVLVPDENGDEVEMYTRDGSFTLNQDNELVTKDGFAVVGSNGPIILKGESFSVGKDGTIIQGDQAVGKLSIKEFINPQDLRKYGMNLYKAPEEAETQNFSGVVEQGYTEQSNVDIVREMVDMITVMRAYEANQKVLQTQDGTLEKAVNEVGALR